MGKVDYRKQIGNFAYWRNVANEGRGSQMTMCLHEACDYAVKLETDRAELVEALSMLVERDARRAGPMLLFPFDDSEQASFVLSEARALLARLEAE